VLAGAAAGPRRRDRHRATWPTLRRDLDRLHVGTFTGPAGTFRQRTDLTKAQRDIFAKLQLPPPKQIIELATRP
jgi:hypothetical protein